MNQKTEDSKFFKIAIAGFSTLPQKEVKKLVYDFLAKRNDFIQFAILDSE